MPPSAIPLNREQRRRKRAEPRYIPELVPIARGAELLDCHERTIKRLAARGHIKLYKVGRHLKVDERQILEYVTPLAPEDISA
jgi:excisionase family DNA binding protein